MKDKKNKFERKISLKLFQNKKRTLSFHNVGLIHFVKGICK